MGGKNSKKSTQLKEKEIKLLEQKTGLSRQEILDWHAEFLRDYTDGLIDQNEFVDIYKRLYTYGRPEKYAQFAFKVFDADNNGKIGFSEFLVATAFQINSSSADDVEKSYEFAFDVYDSDNNGKVDKKEALALLTAVYELENGYSFGSAQSTVDEFFANYDSDNTGYLNKREFVRALSNDPNIRNTFLAN